MRGNLTKVRTDLLSERRGRLSIGDILKTYEITLHKH